jgi:hypothetical protein
VQRAAQEEVIMTSERKYSSVVFDDLVNVLFLLRNASLEGDFDANAHCRTTKDQT